MKDMDYIESSGLRALVAAHLGAKTHGAEMRLCNLGRKFSKALQQTLAQITDGSVKFEPAQVVLTIPNTNFDANSPQTTQRFPRILQARRSRLWLT
jgi:hypothetical protein